MAKTPRKILRYTPEIMLKAIEDVKEKGNSVKAAAKKFGVPRITLLYKVNGKLPVGKRMGPKSLFTTEQENILVEWVISMSKAGFPISKHTFMGSVTKLAAELGLEKPPGEKWYKLFRGRQKKISDRIYQTLTRSRTNVTMANIAQWFQEVHTYLAGKNLLEVLNDGARVFNADETAFYLNPKGGKVLAEKGCKSVYLAGANDEKENVTVLMTVNSKGKIAPPMVVYRYKRIPLQVAESMPPDWAIGRSENGWMTQELFYEYMANIFHPWLEKENIETPVIFFIDGHSSHISFHVSDFCAKNGIELIALYPNATHLLQPLDVAVFHSLKAKYKEKVQDWRIAHIGEEMKKKDFPPLVNEAIGEIEPSCIQNGFRKCGLVPWNPEAIKLPLEELQDKRDPKKEDNKKIKEFLKYLEAEMGEQKVLEFEANEGKWEGPKEDLSLYNLWKENRQKLKSNQMHEVASSAENNGSEFLREGLYNYNNELDNDPFSHDDLPIEPSEVNPEIETLVKVPEELPMSSSLDERLVANLKECNQPGDEVPNVNNLSAQQFKSPEAKSVNGANVTNYIDPNVPSPFKRALFWPELKPLTSKRARREKIPAVITSPQNILYFEKKLQAQKLKAEEQIQKKKNREEKRKAEQERKEISAKLKLHKKKKGKQIKKKIEDSDSSSDSVSFKSTDSEYEEDFQKEEGELALENVAEKHLTEGDFVLCEFVGGKRNQTKFIYLCTIQAKKSDQDIQVMGLRSMDTFKREFLPQENDLSAVTYDQIIGKVPQPEILQRGERISYLFKASLPVKEM